ncbi:MAG TPA: pentapeptide repeat-containing protein, partial [Bacteroidales bacterium]|nr:pentapeptide repeat-containing protein [Bacteroidales bacterium]
DLQGANLQRADLEGADLQDANLLGANLQGANLLGANLQDADLQGANLQRADLRYANLLGADLDFSCWPLWCGSINAKVDVKIATQLAYHFCALDCGDAEFIEARKALLSFANKFHRIPEVPKLED